MLKIYPLFLFIIIPIIPLPRNPSKGKTSGPVEGIVWIFVTGLAVGEGFLVLAVADEIVGKGEGLVFAMLCAIQN